MVKMDRTEDKRPDDFGYVLLDLAKRVAKGELGLHDDRSLLMPKKELIKALVINNFLDIQNMIDNELIVAVEEDQNGSLLYHATICMDFLNFLKKLEKGGFPLILQQAIAETYQHLFWALLSDMDYEIDRFREEKGRAPNKIELAYLRVINEWAVSNTITRMEDNILAGKLEELDNIKKRAAKWKRAIIKDIKIGFAEDIIERTIKDVWVVPFRCFRGMRIKAFIDVSSITWTKKEKNLLRNGHFDFALCDDRGHICLAIEYQGTGHYGFTAEDKHKAEIRDSIKKSICDKAGVPLIQLSYEYAFLDTHKRILQNFLEIFFKRRHDYQLVIELLRTHLDKMCSNSPDSTLTESQLANIRHRMDIYEIQGKGESILGLLWDLHMLQVTSSSPLSSILNRLS